jgi:hypothetical protein
MAREADKQLAKMRRQALASRVQASYNRIAEVAIGVIENSRDTLELEYTVKSWRAGQAELQAMEREHSRAGL